MANTPEEVSDYINMEELAEVLGRPAPELARMQIKADDRVLEALRRRANNLNMGRENREVKSPKELRANFHAVEHHTAKPAPTSPEAAANRAGKVAQVTQSRYQKIHPKVRKKTLSVRPPGAPSILEEVAAPVKIIVHQSQSPGDILMLTAAIRDLHASYPGKFVTEMRTSCMDLWENNPNQSKLDDNDPTVHRLYAEYPLINKSNTGPFHFIHGFVQDLEAKLGLPIRPGEFKGDVHIADDEKRWYSQVYEILNKQVPYWIIDAGHKMDFTAKHWGTAKYQEVVDSLPDITFVQVGAKGSNHRHPRLHGDNVIDLVGKTSVRQFVRLMYNAAGVITPVSFPMHLAAAVEVHPWYRRKFRPCITINGGREPSTWEAYSNHQFVHTCGLLPCNLNGGCWRSRTFPVGDGDKKDTSGLCERPVETEGGEIVPACMDMISAQEVVAKVRAYLRFFDYSDENPANWGTKTYEGFPAKVLELRQEALERTKKRNTKGGKRA